MKRILVLLCVAAVISLSGCNGNNSTISAQGTIQLNDGQKWKVDPPMLQHITAMETAIDNFGPGEEISTLKSTLTDNLKGLTSKCTMQGQAHDELHKWLVPLMETVDTMDSNKSIERLKHDFEIFHTFFE